MEKVNFIITSFEDVRKQGSELELNKVYTGEITPDQSKVYYTDNAQCDWVFYVGDTCVLESKKDKI